MSNNFSILITSGSNVIIERNLEKTNKVKTLDGKKELEFELLQEVNGVLIYKEVIYSEAT